MYNIIQSQEKHAVTFMSFQINPDLRAIYQ